VPKEEVPQSQLARMSFQSPKYLSSAVKGYFAKSCYHTEAFGDKLNFEMECLVSHLLTFCVALLPPYVVDMQRNCRLCGDPGYR
jgi:hypothetical protein